jgi:hypothetical protein
LTSEIHAVVGTNGLPVRLALTGWVRRMTIASQANSSLACVKDQCCWRIPNRKISLDDQAPS